MTSRKKYFRSRRAAVAVLAAFLMAVMLGMVGFAVDVGYILVVKSQLQVAADSAAMAAGANMAGTQEQVVEAAQQFAGYHLAGGKNVDLEETDVEYGIWDTDTRTFTPTEEVGNAVRITARRNDTTGGNNMFFGRIFGKESFDCEASAIALGNPRDICFVVDLSGSMNDDTEPCWAVNELSSAGFGTVANDMMAQVFSDMNYGSFPGTSQYLGYSLGVSTSGNGPYANLTSSTGPLTSLAISTLYRINSGDNESTRKQKAYRYIIEQEMTAVMPNADPALTNDNYSYWQKYLDYIIRARSVSGRGTIPYN